MAMTFLRPTALLLSLAALTACSGDQLVGVHVTLAEDGAGTITTRALTVPDPARVEAAAGGTVDWQARAAVVASQGRFARLSDVKIGGPTGLRFAATLDGEQPSVRVYVPRGAAQQWVQALVPDAPQRRSLAPVYDPTGRTREVGDTIRLELELPGEVVASSVHPPGRGIEADRERKRAYLLVPAREAIKEGEELVWDVTWR